MTRIHLGSVSQRIRYRLPPTGGGYNSPCSIPTRHWYWDCKVQGGVHRAGGH